MNTSYKTLNLGLEFDNILRVKYVSFSLYIIFYTLNVTWYEPKHVAVIGVLTL